jgi:hexosaminidase
MIIKYRIMNIERRSMRAMKILFVFLGVLFAWNFQAEELPEVSIVPKPVSVKMKHGTFIINEKTQLLIMTPSSDLKLIAQFLELQLLSAGGPSLRVQPFQGKSRPGNAVIIGFSSRKSLPEEGYFLQITQNNILLEGKSGAGVFRGLQTLFQVMPPEICKAQEPGSVRQWEVPCLEITDFPRYPYRGMHLDVSRHFFPVDFIKRYIDLIAMYRMNTFHWHLTDDNGWRIEIKKYPKLMEVSAWRVDREQLPWTDRPQQQPGERATYGGYYNQDQIRDIVQYAAQRYITVIPEIEMPAHSVEVLSAYPQLSCTGGPFTVPPGSYWPNSDIFCAGNDSVFIFLEDVLSEVMELFPSAYIHIGGDEADKTRWKDCPKCQKRMKDEGLKNEMELQSYFMKRMERFIVSNGRKMIGWDEILEGGLAPEATVMSWRGIEGGIAAARQGHDAIMTPTSHCYFDYYQADPASEPKAIGGLTTLKKVYSYDPLPEELTREEGKHILGAQGNVWTEYIPSPEQAEYMSVPRMLALAEVCWTPSPLRNWDDFRKRLFIQFKRLDAMNVHYSRGSFKAEIGTHYDKKTGTVRVILTSEQPGIPIHYTTDGNEPATGSQVYKGPFYIHGNTVIKAGLFEHGQLRERISEMPVIFHKAIGKKVKYLQDYSYRYPAGGDGTFTDGIRGSTNHRDGYWQGFLGNDIEVVIDLGKKMPVQNVSVTFLRNQRAWIFLPDVVEFSLSSDGKKFHSINEQLNLYKQKDDQVSIQPVSQIFPNTVARYIKVKAKNPGRCPAWHEGAGELCWIFMDDILVY